MVVGMFGPSGFATAPFQGVFGERKFDSVAGLNMKSKYLLLAATLVSLLSPRMCHADGRSYNTTGTLDWVMVEERRPFFQGSNWSPFEGNGYPVVSSEGASFDFYTGLGNSGAAGSGFWHWSTWPISNPINLTDTISIAYLGSTTTGHGSDGAEGTSSGMDNLPVFGFATNVWYRFAIRAWQPADGTPHLGYVGEWMREGTSGIWYHCGTFQTPFAAQGVTGLGGFMEGLGNGCRQFDFRNAYAHQYGQPAATIQRANKINIAWNGGVGYAALIENATAAMGWQWNTVSPAQLDPLGNNWGTNMPLGSLTLTMTNQPATPPFDPIVVTSSNATVYGSQLLVQWSEPATSSPQLSYRIEVFNNSGYTGSPAVNVFNYDTEAQQCLLNIPGVSTPYVRLTIADIFNNTNSPILLAPVTATLSPATNVLGAVNGLAYSYYQTNGTAVWTSLPNFATLTPVLQGAVNNLDLTPRQQRAEYAFNYRGFFQAPSNGLYNFTLTCFDSSELIIDGTVVINFNGLHQPASKSGGIALAAGKHAVNVQYAFSDQRGQTTDWDGVWLACSGPGLSNSVLSGAAICPGLTFSAGVTNLPVPDNCWFRVPGGSEPVITLTSPASGATICGSNIALNVSIATNGAALSKVQYFVGGYFLGQSAVAPYASTAFYGPSTNGLYRARLFCNSGYTLDTMPQTLLATTNMDVSPWQLTPLEFHNYPTGAKVAGANVSLTGDSVNLLTRQVTGDCTFIAHLAGITANVAGPDGTGPDTGWRAGIIMRGTLNLTIGQPLGDGTTTRSTELFSSVGGGTYYEDDTMRGGNGDANMWSSDVGGANRWFKIVRAGDLFTSSVSTDGLNWTVVRTNTLTGIGTSLYAGMFIHAPQTLNGNLFSATLDNVNITGAVVGLPSVSVSPSTARASVGQSVTFSSGVVGQPPFNYQWQLNGTNLVGATNATLTLTNVQLTNSGAYTVSLTASNGSAISSAAILTVVVPLAWDAKPATTGVQDGSGNWGGTGTNWWDGTNNLVWQDNNTAVFGVNTTTNCTVTLTNDVTPLSLTFNATGGGTYTLAGTNTIWAMGNPLPIVANANATITANFNGSGGMTKSGGGTLTFSGNNNNASTGGTFINGGTLVLNATSWGSYAGGGIYINNGSTFKVTEVGGGYRYDFGGDSFTFDANGGGTIDTSTGVNFVFMGGNTFVTGGGAQDFIIGSSGLNLNGNTATFNVVPGTGMSDLKAASYIWNSGSVVKNGNGILELAATNTYTGSTTVNAGTLWVNGRTATGAMIVTNSGTLGGTGIISGATTINAGGTLSPGTTNIGTLTISNTLTLAGGAVMHLNKTAGSSDKVQGSSAVTYGGTLNVTNISGTLAAADTFTLFTATSYAGSFTGINLPVLNAGLAWDFSSLPTNGVVKVVAFTGITPPASAPSGLTATPVSTNQIMLNWSAVSNSTTYVLSRGGTPMATLIGTNYLDVSLSGGTMYCYTVAAVNTGGSSAASASACATTPIIGALLTWDANGGTSSAQDGSGTWGSGPVNWLYGIGDLVWADGNAAAFGVNTTTNCIVTITNDVTPTGIIFNPTGGGSYTIAGSGGGINLSGTPLITASNNAAISTVVKGTGSLTKAGGSALILSGANTYTGDTIVNGGTLVANQNNGAFNSSAFHGAIFVNSGATLSLSNNPTGWGGGLTTLNVNGGTVTGNGGLGAFAVIYNLTGGTITGAARLDLGSYNSVNGAINSLASSNISVINNSQGILLRPDSGQTNYTITTAPGTTSSGVDLQINDAIGQNGSACSLTKAGAGILKLAGVNSYTGATTVSGGALLVSGSLAAGSAVTVQTNGTLGGTGIINGATTIQSGGTLAPGTNGIGKLTFSSSLVLAGNTMMEISRNGGVPTNDLAAVTGTLTQGGSLIVTNVGTNALVLGNSFKLFTAGTYAGAFTNLTLPPLTNGLAWKTITLATNGTITVTNAVVPVIAAGTVALTGGGFTLGGTGGAGQTYILLGATNLMPPAWTPIATNVAGTNGVFGFTDPGATSNVQQFYRVRTP